MSGDPEPGPAAVDALADLVKQWQDPLWLGVLRADPCPAGAVR